MMVSPEHYRKLFLQPAQRYGLATGERGLPRKRDCFPVNTHEDKARGHRIMRGHKIRLKEFTPSLFKWHVTRQDGRYLLNHYRDFVQFIPFDIDCHPYGEKTPRHWKYGYQVDPDDLNNAINEFQAKAAKAKAVFNSLGLVTIWWLSPGNLVNGRHIQGVNGAILLQQAEFKDDLADYCRALRDRHQLDVEFHWADGKLFRFPFQEHMWVVDPDTLEPLGSPIAGCQYSELVTGCEALNKVMAGDLTDVSILQREWELWRKEPGCQDQRAEDVPEALTLPVVESIAVEEPAKPVEVKKAPNRTRCLKRGMRGDLPTIEQSRSVKDTFRRQTQRKLGSRLVWELKLGRIDRETAIQRYKGEMIETAPRYDNGEINSHTCTSPSLLDRTCRRWFKWYENTFDPTKGIAARKLKDAEDRKRLSDWLSYSDEDIIRASNLSHKDKKRLVRLLKLYRKFNGRASAKALYDDPKQRAFTRREWFAFQKRASGLIRVVEEHDQGNHKCRQWSLDKVFVIRIGEQKRMHDLAVILVGRKKEETVYVTDASDDCTNDLTTWSHDVEVGTHDHFFASSLEYEPASLN